MNSEELELSLRTEFESYLKGFLAELRQEVSDFQRSFEAEFEKHKSQTDDAVRKLVERFDRGVQFDQAFNESVVEHLRLARDVGATLTAVAIGEAEKLKEETAPAAEFDKLRDAIQEISSKTSQSEILKSLVDHAANFAPRGAFFIVKNEHFVGWRAFGEDKTVDDSAVRGIQFPLSSDTTLAVSVETLATVSSTGGSHSDDRLYLEALEFGSPDRLYAIPLVARGRGVAVLYADYGGDGIALNPEALETLVRVAGLTVELAAAAAQPAVARPQEESVPAAAPAVEESAVEEPVAGAPVEDTHYAVPEAESTKEFEEFRPAEAEEFQPESPEPETEEPESITGFEMSPPVVETFAPVEESAPATAFEEYSEPVREEVAGVETEPAADAEVEQVDVERFGPDVEEVTYFEPVEEVEVVEHVYEEAIVVEETFTERHFEEPVEEAFPEVIDEPAVETRQEKPFAEVVESVSPAAEPIAEVASTQAARTRYRDRNVDLPIEVPEEERRLHNDARRFARLLVSEIKLYNEQKVADGREAGDLYDRLREAIDRSREMYDKRVQQPVAEKFDYFHYELVTSLAEGHDVKLGASYPGSKVPA